MRQIKVIGLVFLLLVGVVIYGHPPMTGRINFLTADNQPSSTCLLSSNPDSKVFFGNPDKFLGHTLPPALPGVAPASIKIKSITTLIPERKNKVTIVSTYCEIFFGALPSKNLQTRLCVRLKNTDGAFSFLPFQNVVTAIFSFLLLLVFFYRRRITRSARYLAGLFLLFSFAGNVSAQSPQTFNASGTFTVPAGVTSVTVECWGGGGSGGGSSSNKPYGGGGGAGGAYARKTISVIPENPYTVTVGGTKTGTQTAGAQGNPSWFGLVGTVFAQGGAPGAAPNGTIAAGGIGSSSSSIGDFVFAGGNGTDGTTAMGGAGGGGAGSTGPGDNASGTTAGSGTAIGGGNGGTGRATEGDGNPGSTRGGGGSGAFLPTNTSHSGGSGAAGYVVVTWFRITNVSTTSPICSGNPSTVTLTSTSATELPVGTYTVTYDLSAPNATSNKTAIMVVTTAGSGNFATIPLANSGSTTITIKNIASGIYSNAISITNTANITVNTLPTANAGAAMSPICMGGTSAALGGTVGGSATGGTWSTSAGGTFNPSATEFLNTTWTPPAGYTGTATLTLTTSGGSCGTVVASKTINVISLPTVGIGPALTAICKGGTSAGLGGTIGGSATSGLWTDGGVGGKFTPTPNDLNAAWSPPAAYSGTATLKLTTSGGGCGTTSASKTIQVNAFPTIIAQPVNQTTCSGSSATFSVTVSGTPVPTYQWRKDGSNISGATSSSYTIPSVLAADVANYDVVIINSCGTATSNSASLTIAEIDKPLISGCPGNITQPIDPGQCNAVVNWVEPTATVNCASSASLVWTKSHTPGSTFPLGPTIVTYTVTLNGKSDACSFTVNVKPVITCPPNIPHSADAGTCSYSVNIGTPATNTNCGALTVVGTRSDAQALNAPYPIGVTTVTWTASDGTNTSTCQQTITVEDKEPPTFTVPSSIAINTNASCTANVNPTYTGPINTKSDNCTPLSGLIVTYSDFSVPGTCNGNSVIIRTWSVTDSSGNTATKTQVITIVDNIPPTWSSTPPQKTIECSASILPANTGQATATDNCGGSVTVTYSDVTVNGNCAGSSTITRTWKAIDCSGNTSTLNQTINIKDTQPPVLTCNSFSVANPNLIPAGDSYMNLTATDNCGGPVDFVLTYEEYTGLSGKAGFCPASVIRKYVAQDQCGNTSAECTQIITVVDNVGCAVCQDKVPLYFAMLDGSPDGLWISPSVKREGLCCTDVEDPNQGCVSFNVYLDKNAAGLIFNINSGAEPSGSLAYQIDCGPPTAVGDAICLAGGRFYTLTFCKPGGNENTYSIQSISGITGGEGIITRQDANCAQALSVSGIIAAPGMWKVKSPNDQTLLRYLSCTDCLTPVFTPDKFTPPTIVYEVCGILPGTNQCSASNPMTDCAEITIVTLPAITIALNIDLGSICSGKIPSIDATVTPVIPGYTYKWYDGPDGTGTLLSENPIWTPEVVGSYSLVVTETQSGVLCNTAINNFNIAFDFLQPTILAPPQPLVVECNDPEAYQQIANWRATASATDGATSIQVEDDYNEITMACGQTVTVTFRAVDQCGNVGTATSTISVIDTQVPTWTTGAGALNRTLLCSDVTGLTAANTLFPVATDLCDLTLALTKTTGDFVPGSCPNAGTYTNSWTATDDCGNVSTEFTQIITIEDTQAPTWVSAANALNASIGCTDVAGLAAAQALVPVPTDNCDATLSPVKVPGSFVAGSCPETGTYTNSWTVTDGCGNVSTAYTQVITITDNKAPVFIFCPTNLEDLITDGGCSMTNVSIPDPVFTDNCLTPILTWILTGATSASGTDLIPSVQIFNVGKTQVNYTITDASGNTAYCSFQVWIRNIARPQFMVTCPATPITKLADPGLCSTYMFVPSPEIHNPCNEAYTVINDSPFKASPTDASGTYPVGEIVVNWTVTDASGNVYHCPQTVSVIDKQFPVITCQSDIVEIISSDNCSKTGVAITKPEISDNCPNPVLTWTLTGATIGSGTDPIPASQSFNVGKTRVQYTLTDASGNEVTCSFEVWTKNLDQPKFKVTCPVITLINQPSDGDHCYASVVLDPPGITNPCGEAYTMVNSFNSTDNASGHYLIGTTIVNWTITDASGNITPCTQTVTVTDLVPILNCPANIDANADFEQPFASGVIVPAPGYSDNCPGLTLTWAMTGATLGNSPVAGENKVSTPGKFNVGITTITYTLTDANAHTVFCSFTVTVASKPDITCQPGITRNNDPTLCSALINPVLPKLNAGANIIWTWVMAGATNASGTGDIGSYNFNVGTTTITWKATNISGSATCDQIIIVTDNEPPNFMLPQPLSECVGSLTSATYNSATIDINPDRPEYYIFVSGNTALDITAVSDNCCATSGLNLYWRIDFNGGSPASITGSGLLSDYGLPIKFQGDGLTFTNVIHTITYWVMDCNGNTSSTQTQTITVRPRPNIIKGN